MASVRGKCYCMFYWPQGLRQGCVYSQRPLWMEQSEEKRLAGYDSLAVQGEWSLRKRSYRAF